MDRLCSKCGKPVSETAKFCRSCGSALEVKKEPERHVCQHCKREIPMKAKFCRYCGKAAAGPSVATPSVASPADVAKIASEPVPKIQTGKAVAPAPVPASGSGMPGAPAGLWAAPDTEGEVVFAIPSAPSVPGIPLVEGVDPGVLKVLFSGAGGLVMGLMRGLRHPGRLLPGLLLGGIWFAVSMLPVLGIQAPALEPIAWITFAQGGLTGGSLGMAGGIVGKGVYAAVLVGLFGSRSKPAKGKPTDSKAAAPGGSGLFVMGMGLALLAFNFFTGDNSLQNSGIGLMAALGALLSKGRPQGFLHRFLRALSKGRGHTGAAASAGAARLATGLATGFLLAIPQTFSGIPWLAYALGLVAVTLGALSRGRGRKGEVVSR